jgi:hypothetical protein
MKSITYIYEILPYMSNATVKLPNGELLEEQHVIKDAEKYKLIFNNDTTIVILNDGSKGIAKRNPIDNYDTQIGYEIAYCRAKIKSFEKEIKRISKN